MKAKAQITSKTNGAKKMNFEKRKDIREEFRIEASLSDWLSDYASRNNVSKANVMRSLLRELKNKDDAENA